MYALPIAQALFACGNRSSIYLTSSYCILQPRRGTSRTEEDTQ